MNYKKLISKAKKLRQDTFLAFIEKGEAHLGGSFSMIETLLALYEVIMKKNDKFILSKAHASFPLCILLREKGLNPKMTTHLELDAKNGIYCTTGSLGHGFPIAIGRAFGKKLKGKGRVFVLLGDGELSEGSVWEAFILANRFKLDNLHIFIDWNKYGGLDDSVKDLFNFDEESIPAKLRAFGFESVIINGHDEKELRLIKELDSKTVVVLDTIKGKGVKLLEETHFHAINFAANVEDYERALKDLE